jgi:hypothetical protein
MRGFAPKISSPSLMLTGCCERPNWLLVVRPSFVPVLPEQVCAVCIHVITHLMPCRGVPWCYQNRCRLLQSLRNIDYLFCRHAIKLFNKYPKRVEEPMILILCPRSADFSSVQITCAPRSAGFRASAYLRRSGHNPKGVRLIGHVISVPLVYGLRILSNAHTALRLFCM